MNEPRVRSERSDAARNRALLLDAARTVFSEQGNNAPLEDVARVANVSRTTLSRHFPSRDDLNAALIMDGLVRFETTAANADRDPFGLLMLFDFVLNIQLAERPVIPMISAGSPALVQPAARAAELFGPLLEQAREFGTVRPATDLADVLLSLRMATVFSFEPDPEQRVTRQGIGRRVLLRALFTEEAVEGYHRRLEAESAGSR